MNTHSAVSHIHCVFPLQDEDEEENGDTFDIQISVSDPEKVGKVFEDDLSLSGRAVNRYDLFQCYQEQDSLWAAFSDYNNKCNSQCF